MEEKLLRRIVWAVDAFEKPGPLQRNAIRTLERFSALSRDPVEIEPVFVLQEQAAGPSLDFSPVWITQYRTAAEQGLDRILAKVSLPGMLPGRVLSNGTSSTTAGAYSLIQHAMRTRADLILTNTHSKKGLKRVFLGSFAETLLLRSPIPVVTVGPHTAALETGRILFPTEFSRHSFSRFKQVTLAARRMQTRGKPTIVLFHSIPYPVQPYLSANVLFPSTYWTMLQDYLRRERSRTSQMISQWSDWGRAQGISVKSVVDDQPGSVWQAIINAAEEQNVDLIAMETKTGPVAATFAGSTVRQTVRHAPCPVWVLGSRYAKSHLRSIPTGVGRGTRENGPAMRAIRRTA